MGISGSATVSKPRCAEARRGAPTHDALRRVLTAALVTCGLGGPAAAQQTFTFGREVATAPLAQFKPGATTMADVRAALGEPRGDGIVRHNAKEPRRVIWFYEYGQIRPEHGDTQTSLKIVLVFFKDGRYDGHLWFADKKMAHA